MKDRDPLLGRPPTGASRAVLEVGRRGHRGWRDKIAWLTVGHLVFAVAALIGWDHLDLLWPRPLWPNGIAIGAEHRMTGLLTVADRGRPARLTTSAGLLADWRHWIQEDQRQDSSECLALTEVMRSRLVAGSRPRPGSAGVVQYWVDLKAGDRLAPAQCGRSGGLKIMLALDRIESIKPVLCSRDVFVAHGFACPNAGRSFERRSETFEDGQDYYPWGSARAGNEGSVRVQIKRDETGSPIECKILQSSGHDDLDHQTCKLVGTDPAFTPASASKGTDFSQPIKQTVKWRLPTDDGPPR